MGARNESVGNVEMGVEIDFDQLAKDNVKLGKFLEQLGPGLKKVGKSLQEVEDGAKKASKETGLLSDTFKRLFGAMTAANLAADVLRRGMRLLRDTFIGSIQTAIAFERQLVQVRKVTNATGAEMAVLKEFIKDLAVETGIAKDQIADIAAGGARLGIFAREGQKGLEAFTRVIVMSRVAMEDYAGSSEEASDKTARLLNLFGLTSDKSEVLLSIINELSNTAAATSSNIADNAESFASLSQSFDASKESILALATTMEEVGAQPETFSTQLQTVLVEMQKDTQKFANFLGSELGPKFKEVFAEEPVEAFAIFLQGLNRTGRDLGSALESLGIGNDRTIRELAKLSTDKGLERFAQNLETAKRSSRAAEDAVEGLTDAASSLQAEFDRASDTTGRRIDSMQEQLSNLGETFGSEINPALGETVDLLTSGFAKAEPVVRHLGGLLGDMLGTVTALTAQVGSLVTRFAEFVTLVPKSALAFLGFGDPRETAKDLLMRSFSKQSGVPFMDVLNRIEQKRRIEGGESTAGLGAAGLGTGDSVSDLDGNSTFGSPAATEKNNRLLEDTLKLEGDIAKARRDLLEDTREELLLKRELGVLTKDEEKWLGRINRRVEFKKDVIDDATRAWREQIRELERVEQKISDITARIEDERQALNDRLRDIDRDFDRRRLDSATDIAEELAKLEDARLTGPLTGDQSRRYGELLDQAKGLTREELDEGRRRAGLSDAQRLEEDRAAAKEEAKAESDAKIAQLQAELAQERRNRDEIVRMEQEKKQAVINALDERTTVTITNYKLLEDETTRHVNQQIAEFDRLKAAIQSLTTSGNSSITSAERGARAGIAGGFADGGVIHGPGGPTGDKIPAWLSDGEGIIRTRAVQFYGGRPFIDALNRMQVSWPKFAQGGTVTKNSTKNSHVTVNNYGDAARVAADPVLIRWHARKAA